MSDELVAAALEDASERMDKAVVHTRAEFAGVRTGRANPVAAIVSAGLMCEFLGEDRAKELKLKWFASAAVEKFEQMTETQVQACIDLVRKQVEASK